jgi:hypothetical protein
VTKFNIAASWTLNLELLKSSIHLQEFFICICRKQIPKLEWKTLSLKDEPTPNLPHHHNAADKCFHPQTGKTDGGKVVKFCNVLPEQVISKGAICMGQENGYAPSAHKRECNTTDPGRD